MLRVSLIGCGSYGRKIADRVIEHPDFVLESVVETKDKAPEVEFDVSVTTKLGEALRSEPDLAIVAVPASEMFEITQSALYCGVNVLSTKPGATTLDEARILNRVSRDSRRSLLLDYTPIETVAWDHIKRELPRDKDIAITTNRSVLNKSRHGTDPVLDLAVHDIALLCDLSPEPAALSCDSTLWEDNNTKVTIKISDGIGIEATIVAQHGSLVEDRSMTITQGDAHWVWNQHENNLITTMGDYHEASAFHDANDSIIRQLNRAQESITKSHKSDHALFQSVMRIAEQAQANIRNGEHTDESD